MNLPLPTQLSLTTPTFLIPPHIPTHIIHFHPHNHPSLPITTPPTNPPFYSKPILKEFFGEELSNFAAQNPNTPFLTSITKIKKTRKSR